MPSLKRAIMHLDADAFFASVETALNPSLRGKPVAVINAHLGNRAMVLAASYEARPFGVKTGVRYVDAKKLCPHAVFVPLDMHSYGLYSLRVAAVLRRFSPLVEEASIDEWFVDLGGLRQVHHTGYTGIAKRIQETIRQELNLSVSCGIAGTKVLAKMASDFHKPRGCTLVREREREDFLSACAAGDIPGVGPNTQALMSQLRCETALDVLRLGETRMQQLLGKRGHDLWSELNGEPVSPVINATARQQSLSHNRTFLEPHADPVSLHAEVQLLLLEAAAKLRKLHLTTKELWLVLREADFTSHGARLRLDPPTANEDVFIAAARRLFHDLYVPGKRYRAACVGMGQLVQHAPQLSLFDTRENRTLEVLPAVDALNASFGRGTVTRASALPAHPKDKAFVGGRSGRRLDLPLSRAHPARALGQVDAATRAAFEHGKVLPRARD